MAKLRRIGKAHRIALISVIVATMAGCTQTSDWLKGRRTAKADDPVILGAPEADVYLTELYDLAAGDPARQAEIFADAESRALLTPGPNTELRYALVLATPGHPESNPEKAQSILREVLAQPALLTPAEISLATIHLNNVERFIVVNCRGSPAARLELASCENRRAGDQPAARQR